MQCGALSMDHEEPPPMLPGLLQVRPVPTDNSLFHGPFFTFLLVLLLKGYFIPYKTKTKPIWGPGTMAQMANPPLSSAEIPYG